MIYCIPEDVKNAQEASDIYICIIISDVFYQNNDFFYKMLFKIPLFSGITMLILVWQSVQNQV